MAAQRLLTEQGLEFVRERHLATLSTVRTDGSLHVVAVGFTWHDGLVRVITSRRSQKVLNAVRDGRGAVGQVDGARWLSVSGAIEMRDDPDEVRLAERLYAERYRTPRPNPERVVLVITPEALLGSAGLVESVRPRTPSAASCRSSPLKASKEERAAEKEARQAQKRQSKQARAELEAAEKDARKRADELQG